MQQRERNAAIRAAYKAGQPIAELSRAYGLTRQRIDQILKPHHSAARSRLHAAVRDGRLVRPSACSRCLRTDRPVQAHHDDYSKALDVTWLCSMCHADIDRGRTTVTAQRPVGPVPGSAMQPSELALIRETFGWSRGEFARRLGVADSTVWRWEMGQRPVRRAVARLIRMLAAAETKPAPVALA